MNKKIIVLTLLIMTMALVIGGCGNRNLDKPALDTHQDSIDSIGNDIEQIDSAGLDTSDLNDLDQNLNLEDI